MIFLQNDIIAPKVYIVETTKVYIERINMERKFRTLAKNKTWTYKNVSSVYNDSNGIYCISLNNTIILKEGFKPVKRKGGYIDIIMKVK